MQKDGSIGLALEIFNKLNALCKAYLKSNDCAKDAKADRSRAQNLLDTFLRCEQIQDQVCDGLDEFIHGGTKSAMSATRCFYDGTNQFQMQSTLILRQTKKFALNNNILRLRWTQWHFHFFNKTIVLLLCASTWCLMSLYLISVCLMYFKFTWHLSCGLIGFKLSTL